jgi:hypothetical protein
MGLIACYTGLILWYLFCQLDSDLYPVKAYSDLGHRVFGTWFGHMCAVLQTVQLIVNVATLILSNGQSLSQITSGRVRHSFSPAPAADAAPRSCASRCAS